MGEGCLQSRADLGTVLGLGGLCVLALAASVGGCGRTSGAGADRSFAVQRHVSRAEYERAPRLQLVLLSRACAAESSPGCPVDTLAHALLGPGRTMLLVPLRGVAAVFDSSGRWLRDVGRTGAGPGEYRRVMAAGVDTAGAITLFDASGFRVVTFDAAGRPAATRAVRPPIGFQGVKVAEGRPIAWVVPGGRTIGDTVLGNFVPLEQETPSRALASVAVRSLTRAGSDLMPLPPLFAAYPVWDVGPGLLIVFSPGDLMRIERYGEDGALDLLVDVDIARRAVSDADLERELSRRSARTGLSGFGGPEQRVIRAQLAEARRNAAAFHPSVRDVRVLRDGTILVKGSPVEPSDSVRWDVFDRSGDLAGYYLLPQDARISDGDDRVLLLTGLDREGAPYAGLFRR